MSQTSTAHSATTIVPPQPPPISLIPIEVLKGFHELLSHPHHRDTIIGASAVNALLMAELVRQVACIAEWHNRTGQYFMGAGPSGSPLSGPPGPLSSGPSGPPSSGPSGPPSSGTSGSPSHGPLGSPAVPAPVVSGSSPSTLTPFMADLNTVLLSQLALRDTLITGLQTDLGTAKSDIADLKTKHAELKTTVDGVQTQVNNQIDMVTKQGNTLGHATSDIVGLTSVQGDLSNLMSALRADVTSARGQLEPLVGRVEQMVFDLARQDVAIQEIARNAAAAANAPPQVVVVEPRGAKPQDTPEDDAEINPRGGSTRRRR